MYRPDCNVESLENSATDGGWRYSVAFKQVKKLADRIFSSEPALLVFIFMLYTLVHIYEYICIYTFFIEKQPYRYNISYRNCIFVILTG